MSKYQNFDVTSVSQHTFLFTLPNFVENGNEPQSVVRSRKPPRVHATRKRSFFQTRQIWKWGRKKWSYNDHRSLFDKSLSFHFSPIIVEFYLGMFHLKQDSWVPFIKCYEQFKKHCLCTMESIETIKKNFKNVSALIKHDI